jgi:lysophospholipase L1-like esterase
MAGTSHTVTYGGSPAVTIQPGQEVFSDPVRMTVPSETDLEVSLYSAQGTGTVNELAGGGETTGGYYATGGGDQTTDTSGQPFLEPTAGWFIVDGIDVMPDVYTPEIVAFGDSITEGLESTPDLNHRYPDFLGERLLSAAQQFSIVNEGISSNQLLPNNPGGSGAGQPGLVRFGRDVLSQTGVREVLMLIGINDTANGATADQVIAGYRKMIAHAHAHGLRVIAGTLTPVGDTTGPDLFSNGSAFSNAQRKAINDWIRTSGAFDGVIDFDAAVRDPLDPNHWRRGYSYDNLHGNDLGYQLMADSVPLSVFGDPACPGTSRYLSLARWHWRARARHMSRARRHRTARTQRRPSRKKRSLRR